MHTANHEAALSCARSVQTWLFRFFGDRVSVLPDTYNWKPYWGYPEAGAWGDAPAVRIIHIHGPKFQESLCVLKYLGVNNLTDASNTTLLTKIKDLCNYKRNQYSMQLLLDANKVCFKSLCDSMPLG